MDLKKSLKQLEEALMEANINGWKGENSVAVSLPVAYHSLHFLRLLPDDIPNPNIAAEPDGEIEFEWYKNPDRNFSVSVNKNGGLNYVGKMPKEIGGNCNLLEDYCLSVIINSVKKVYE